MSLKRFLRLLWGYKWAFLLFPFALAGTVIYLTKQEDHQFTTSSLIYTGLASGYTIETESRRDYFSISIAFDNLINTVKSRAALEEVGIRLMAEQLMLRKPYGGTANANTFYRLHAIIPDDVVRKVVNYYSLEQTVQNIYRYSKIPKNVIGEKLLNLKSPYSVSGILANLTVTREGSSDMVRISYIANDPAVVKRTIELITSVFMRRYQEMKVNETGSVVAYFQQQLELASNKLSSSEANLTNFSRDNRIINYYEQTKSFTLQDRDFNFEIDRERANLESSKATVKQLANRLNIRQDVILQSTKLNAIRDSLSLLNTRLTMLDMQAEPDPSQREKLINRISDFEQKAKTGITELYSINNSLDGLPTKLLFDNWMQAFVNTDAGEARLLALYDIRQNYESYYRRFAPLGSKMGQLQRAINVAEKEYLEILHGLSVSKLREQNMVMSSNLTIVDPPLFPGTAEPSKRLFLVIGSYVLGFILVLSFMLGKEYFDRSLKNPTRALGKIKLPFIGAIPLANERKTTRFKAIESITVNQCLAKMALMTAKVPNRPILIVVFSIRGGEGKSYFISSLLRAVENLDPADRPDYIIQEIESLLYHPIHDDMVKHADLSILVADASKKWQQSDAYMLKTYLDGVNHPTGFVLNRVQTDQLDDIIGEFPRPKSRTQKRKLLLGT
ncbi:GumC family protein [Spirosoma litoris]